MAMGPGNFANIFKRLDVELDRMRRAGVSNELIDNFKIELLKYKPLEEPPIYNDGKIKTTPYQVAFNRLEGYKRGDYTWEFYEQAWHQCSPEDQAALNDYVTEGE